MLLCRVRWVLLLLSLAACVAAQPKQVVVMLPRELAGPDGIAIVRGIQSAFATRLPGETQVSPEYVDGSPDETPWLAAKYQGRRVDLILTYPRQTLTATLALRARLQPPPPVLLYRNVTSTQDAPPEAPWLHRIEYELRQFVSIETALQLLPSTRRLAYIGGHSPYDLTINSVWLKQIAARWPQLEIIDLTRLPLAHLRQRVGQLPAHTIGFLGVYNTDSDGRPITRRTLVADLAPQATAPLFDLQDDAFGAGIVGGWLRDTEKIGFELALHALPAIRNQPMPPVLRVPFSGNHYRFDERELHRWHIDPARLPAGSSLEFHQPTFWEDHWPWIVASVAVYALLVGLLIRLLRERTRRRRTEAELARRAEFESILAQTSHTLTQRDAFFCEEGPLRQAMERFRRHAQVSRVTLFFVRLEQGQPRVYLFSAPEYSGSRDPAGYTAINDSMRAGRELRIRDAALLPSPDRETLLAAGTRAVLVVPARVPGHDVGGIGLADHENPRDWPDELACEARRMAESAGQIWANAMAEEELNRSASLSSAILTSHNGYVVALDRDGAILLANSPPLLAGPVLAGATPGAPYSSLWRTAGPTPLRLLAAIDEVLAGCRPEAEEEIDTGDRWLLVHAIPLQHERGGAVVTHFDITESKRAALSGAHDLNQISHWNRVSALGELASSLAHELNQPLAAILANAETAKTLLAAPTPDLAEVDAALADVHSDGRRAAAIIRDMRALLRKNRRETAAPLDVSGVVKETLRLVENDAARRRVRLSLDLGCGGALAAIDRTNLQQVLLNLLTNALDATSTVISDESRWVALRTACRTGRVHIEVADGGPGVAPRDRTRIFEPFVTTKPDGLGVGLSISRSIVEAAGGTIEIVETPTGTAFRVALPLVAQAIAQARGA